MVKQTTANLQNMIDHIRSPLYDLFLSLLKNKRSRERTLQFFNEVLIRNKNRAQLQSDERVLAGDGFFFNLTSVLQQLSADIKRDKIDPYYPYNPENTLAVKKDDSRIKFSSTEANSWLEGLPTSQTNFKWDEASFSTQCFFQTMVAHHLSVIPCQRKYVRRLRVIRELNRFIESQSPAAGSAELQPPQSSAVQARVRKCKEQMLKFHKAKLCAEAGLLDERFLGRCIVYYNQFVNFLFKVINCDSHLAIELPLAEQVPPIFASYPEWYIHWCSLLC